MGLFDNIAGLEVDDEEQPLGAPRIAAHAQLLPEQRIYGSARSASGKDSDLDEHSLGGDILSGLGEYLSAGGAPSAMHAPAIERLSRRAGRVAREFSQDPGDAATAAASGATFGGLDDILASGAEHPLLPLEVSSGGLLSGLNDWVAEATGGAQQGRDMRAAVADAQREASDRSPHLYPTAETVGTLLGAAAIPSAAVAPEASLVTRAGIRAAEGAGVMGAAGALSAEPGHRLEGALAEAPTGAAFGVGGSMLEQGARSAAGALRGRAARRVAEARVPDRYFGAAGGERSLSPARLREFGTTPDERRATYALVEPELPLGPLDTPYTIRDRARAAADASYARSQSTRQDFDEAGGLIPIDELTTPLRQHADELTLDPTMDRIGLAEHTRSVADSFARHPDRLLEQGRPVPLMSGRMHMPGDPLPMERPGMGLREMERGLRTHGQGAYASAAERTVPRTDVDRDIYGLLRGAEDERVAQVLGGEAATGMQRERLRTQALENIYGQAENAVERQAGHAGHGIRGLATGALGASVGGGLGHAVGGPEGAAVGSMAGMYLGRELSALARPSDLARRYVTTRIADEVIGGTIPRALEQWADVLRPAMRRGPEAVQLVLHVLEQTDPRFTDVVDAEAQVGDSPAPDPFADIEGLDFGETAP